MLWLFLVFRKWTWVPELLLALAPDYLSNIRYAQ